jgi:large subunit ribosomal protein L24
MQKLIRRADLAKRQAVRRKTAQNGKIASDTLKNHRNERDEINRSIIRDIRHERTARREDWQMGPLAPKRDVGRATKTYGALTSQRTQGIDNPNWKDYHIVENDRVVIVTKGHRDQGKIGRVTEVRKEKEECIIEDLNKASVLQMD